MHNNRLSIWILLPDTKSFLLPLIWPLMVSRWRWNTAKPSHTHRALIQGCTASEHVYISAPPSAFSSLLWLKAPFVKGISFDLLKLVTNAFWSSIKQCKVADASEFCTEAADLGAILLWAFLKEQCVWECFHVLQVTYSVYGSICCNHRIESTAWHV